MTEILHRSITLSEVLTDEYESLGLIKDLELTPDEWDRVKKAPIITNKVDRLVEEKLTKIDPKSQLSDDDTRKLLEGWKVEELLRLRGTISFRDYMEAYREAQDSELGIAHDFRDTLKMSRSEQAEQLERRQIRQARMVARIRHFLNRSQAGGVGPSALCLSGGGIRSATFCLGIVQTLARHGLLEKFDYLSTVSGGGYIGSWLSAWMMRVGSSGAVQKKLCGEDLPDGRVEPDEVSYLRTYSNYMSPRLGLFSTDTWVLIVTYFRNLLLNWTVFVPLIAAMSIVPVLFAGAQDSHLLDRNSDVILWSSVVLAAFGVASANLMRPSLKYYSYRFLWQQYEIDNIGYSRPHNFVVLLCVVPTVASAFLLTTYAFKLIQTGPENGATFEALVWGLIPNLAGIGAIIFLGGYFFSWLFVLPNYLLRDPDDDAAASAGHLSRFIWEPILSGICGLFGGVVASGVLALLYTTTTRDRYIVSALGPLLIITIYLLAGTLFIGVAVRIMSDEDREWTARLAAILIKIGIAWTILAAAVIYGPQFIRSLFQLRDWMDYAKSAGAVFTIVTGVLSAVSGFGRKTPAAAQEPEKDRTGLLISLGSSIAAPLFILFLLMLLATGLQQLPQIDLARYVVLPLRSDTQTEFTWMVVFITVGTVMGLFININKFSFHSIYRDRLIRAYLGASNPKRPDQANSFSGLNTDDDNVEMKSLLGKPFHVVNIALNLVNSTNLAWQNRKAESFTVSRLHSGSSSMGRSGNYRPSSHYGSNIQSGRAITLGTAAAVSGAAVSSNMGYITLGSAVSLLMVLLNVRLGWWLGNPGKRGAKVWQKATPNWSPVPFFSEAFDATDDEHKWVYLSDGGHFDNLGLYEMILRRCKTIVVCDAGADPGFTFFDLGSVIHKVRVDMGIPIKFRNDDNPVEGRNCAIATIAYSEIDEGSEDGTLIYIKPTLDGSEPVDIFQYKKSNPSFPHETTADQMYSETQFESYRKLGYNMMGSICDGPMGIEDLKRCATKYLQSHRLKNPGP